MNAPGIFHKRTSEDEYDPFGNRRLSHPTNTIETFFHLIKTIMSTSFVAVPWAFMNGGLLFSIFGTIFAGILCAHCNQMLVRSAYHIYKRKKVPYLDYGEIAAACCELGSAEIRKYAKFFQITVNFLIISFQFMTCCALVVFVAENVKQMIDDFATNSFASMQPVQIFILAVLPIFLSTGQLANLKWLAPTSIFASILMLVGITMTIPYILLEEHLHEKTANVELIADPSRWPLFFGTMNNVLEGANVLMFLENNMVDSRLLVGFPCSIVTTGYFILVCLYCLIGFIGYFHYGKRVRPMITDSFNNFEKTPLAIQALLSISAAFTYCLQFHIFFSITWKIIQKKFKLKSRWEHPLRVLMILFTAGIAAGMPSLLIDVMPLVGSISISTLGIIFPAAIEVATYWEEPGFGKYEWRLWKNCFIVLIGFMGTVSGAYTSIELLSIV